MSINHQSLKEKTMASPHDRPTDGDKIQPPTSHPETKPSIPAKFQNSAAPIMKSPPMVTMEHVQNVSTVAGFSWGTIWNIVQKLSPQLQQIVMTIIEELAKQPTLATINIANAEGTPTWAISRAEAQDIATAQGFDVHDLLQFFQLVGPILSRIIAAFFKQTIPVPGPGPVPGPNPNPMPAV